MNVRDFDETILGELQDPEFAQAYLADALEDGLGEFLIAMRKFVQANGGIAQCAEASGLTREAVYRMLSPTGNPEFRSIVAILRACGLGFSLRVAVDRGLDGDAVGSAAARLAG